MKGLKDFFVWYFRTLFDWPVRRDPDTIDKTRNNDEGHA